MAYIPPLNGGRLNASIGGNSTSAGAGYKLVSTGTVLLAGGNNITLSQNGSSITISGANAPSGSINFSASNASANLASVNFGNANGVSFGLNGSTITASHNALTSQSNQAISGSNGSFAFQTATFGNLNGMSFYTTNGSLVGSYTVPTQTNQTLSQAITGNTTGNTSGMSVDARSLTLQGLGAASVGISTSAGGSSVIISAPTQTVQTQSNIQAFYDGANSISTGTIRVSNLNGVSFGINGQTLTASHNAITSQTNQTVGLYGLGNTTQNSSTTLDARSLSFNGLGAMTVGYSNSSIQLSAPVASSLAVTGIVSISTNGSTVSIGAPAFSAGMSTLGNTAGTTGTVSNQFILAGGNNVTLSQSTGAGGNTLTISAANQSVQTQNLMTVNGTQGAVSISGGANVTVGNNASTITISAAAQTNQTLGINVTGNTLQTSTGTVDARSLTFNGLGNVSVGYSNGSVQISGAGGAGGGVALYDGAASITSGTASFSNANGVSFGINGQTVTGSVAAQTNQTINFSAGSQSALTASGTMDARSFVLNGVGAASVGFSQSSAFVSVPTQTNQVLSITAINNIEFNSSATLNASNIKLEGLGNVSVGFSNNSIVIHGVQSNQTQNLVSINGSTGNISFDNAGNVDFGLNGSTISASYSQTNQNMSLYALGNTTQNSSTLLNASNLSFNGLGNVTVGYSAGSIQISGAGGGGGGIALANTQGTVTSGTAYLNDGNGGAGAITISSAGQSFNFSVPATSSLLATGDLNIVTNGATISIGVPSAGTISNWEPLILQHASLTNTQLGAGSLYFHKLAPQAFISASQLLQLVSMSISSSSNSSHAGVISLYAGIYTASGSTLSLITQSSGTTAYQWTNTSNNSTASLMSLRGMSLPINIGMSPGNYWLGLMSKTTFTNSSWFTASNMVVQVAGNSSLSYLGMIGQTSNATQGVQEGIGVFSASTAGLPASVGMSQITQSRFASHGLPYIAFKNQTW